MNVLAFDTCLDTVSVALLRQPATGGEAALVEATGPGGPAAAERLLPMIADVMARAGIGFPELGRLAVTLGPGSFTGVRTTIATARALRLAAGIDVVGISSLAAIALAARAARPASGHGGAPADMPLLAAVDARRGHVYAQLFAADGTPLTEPAELPPAAALELAAGQRVRVAGSGAALLATVGTPALVECSEDAAAISPRAADLARLASTLAPLENVAPIYLRPPDAKPQAAKSLVRTS